MSMHLPDFIEENPSYIKVPDLEQGELHLKVSIDHFVYIRADYNFKCQGLSLLLPIGHSQRQWFKLRSLIKKGSGRLGQIAFKLNRTQRFLVNNPAALHRFDW